MAVLFTLSQQDNIDRSSNHRQADLIGPAFQQTAHRSSPNHQGWYSNASACGCDVDGVYLFCSWCSSLAVQFPDVLIQLTFVYLLSQYSVVSSLLLIIH